MPLSAVQQLVADDTHRFRVVIAGRRVGKSTLAIRELCRHACKPDVNVWAIGPSYRSIKMTLWKPLKKKLLEQRWVDKINESSLEITLKNGSTISLKGSDNPDSLRGAKLYFAAIDEIADCDPDLFPEIIRPALADSQGSALMIGTPKGKNNHSFDLFNMQLEYPDHWRSWTFTTAQGGFVSQAEIDAARADMNEKLFKQEFEASFETVEAQIAWAFTRDNIRIIPDLPLHTLHIGCDFNVSPICACIMVQDRETMWVIDEIQMMSSNTQELADEITLRYPRSRIIAYPDPAGSARTTKSNQSDHSILRNSQFTIRAPRAHDSLRDRFNALNSRLCTATGIRYLFIAPHCKYTIESLEKYSYRPGTQIPDKGGDPDYSHMFDALSYCIAYLWPVKTNYQPAPMQMWAHRLGSNTPQNTFRKM